MSLISEGKRQVDIIWSKKLIPYDFALDFMDKKIEEVNLGKNGAIWFLQHPHIYTLGTSASSSEVLDVKEVPLYKSGRGGKTTYHGPGQSVIYLMLPLKMLYNQPDIHRYINDLQKAVISALACFGLECYLRDDMVGVWCRDVNSQDQLKIAAVGVRVRKWVTMHGIAVNIDPDISYFSRIIPCGIKDYGVTSCKEQGSMVTMDQFNIVLLREFMNIMNCIQGDEYEV